VLPTNPQAPERSIRIGLLCEKGRMREARFCSGSSAIVVAGLQLRKS
jgi:hypothetical protein